jgi:DNA-binding NarL/FixJ family response regulator
MSAVDQQRGTDPARAAKLLSAIVIAQDAELRARIVAALEELDLTPSAMIDSTDSLPERGMGESTIVMTVCDIDVPREVTSLRRLRREAVGPAIVVISPPATGAAVRRALDAGADALVFEPELELTLAATIRAVASGQSVVPRKLRASVERPTLSHREHQVLTLVGEGLTNAEIAERLYLAESTVKSHLASVFTKFGVHSRKEAVTVFGDLALAPVGAPAGLSYEPSVEQTTA